MRTRGGRTGDSDADRHSGQWWWLISWIGIDGSDNGECLLYVSNTSLLKAGRDRLWSYIDSITAYSCLCLCSCLCPCLRLCSRFKVRKGTLIIRKRRQSDNEQSESVSIGLFPQILINTLNPLSFSENRFRRQKINCANLNESRLMGIIHIIGNKSRRWSSFEKEYQAN